jgi:RHS repeat-associated protein
MTIERDSQQTPYRKRKYAYDGLDVIAELDADDNLVASYTHGPGIDDPIILRLHGGVGAGNYFYHKNHQGSITEITNNNQQIAKSYMYDAYGKTVSESGPSLVDEPAYTARERHDRTGLYYYRNRFYSPQIGRFITQDPIGLLGGTNLYAYVGNDPINFIDPLGLNLLEFGANFGAGMGDALTDPTGLGYSAAGLGYSLSAGPDSPEVPDLTSGTEALRLAFGVDEAVDKCSKTYRGGEYTGYTVGLLLVGGMTASPAPSSWANSSWFGRGSRLFGRSRYGQTGILNRGPVRLGWGYNGTVSPARHVFRLSWSTMGNRTFWNHLDIFWTF